MKKPFIILFVFALTSLLNGQITITQADVQSQFTFGNRIVDHVDTLIQSVDIGTSCINNDWDFSNLSSTIVYEQTILDPKETDYADEFPDAYYVSYQNISVQGVSSEFWWYGGFEANNLVSFGFATYTQGQNEELKTISKSDPAELSGLFPATVGATWSYSGTETHTAYPLGFPIETESYIDVDYVVDAYGTMILPSGKRVEALRLFEDRRVTIRVPFGQNEYHREILYTFITKTGEEVSVSLEGENQPNSGVVQINGAMWNDVNVTSVDYSDVNQVEDFYLKQNYPNPFNPSTTIEYSITESSFVELKVYNLLGVEVANLVSRNQSAGKYKSVFNANDLPSGNYLISLKTENFSDVKKMTLLK